MVEHLGLQIGIVFQALSHEVRREMLASLAREELSVSSLARPHAMSLAAASKHVKLLEDAGLIRRRVVGREHLCRLDARPLAQVTEWLRFYESFWTEGLDALGELVEINDEKEK